MGVQMALSGARKAAILTLVIGEEASAPILKHLHEDEVEAIAREVALLGGVPRETGEQVRGGVPPHGAGRGLRGPRRRGVRPESS